MVYVADDPRLAVVQVPGRLPRLVRPPGLDASVQLLLEAERLALSYAREKKLFSRMITNGQMLADKVRLQRAHEIVWRDPVDPLDREFHIQ